MLRATLLLTALIIFGCDTSEEARNVSLIIDSDRTSWALYINGEEVQTGTPSTPDAVIDIPDNDGLCFEIVKSVGGYVYWSATPNGKSGTITIDGLHEICLD